MHFALINLAPVAHNERAPIAAHPCREPVVMANGTRGVRRA